MGAWSTRVGACDHVRTVQLMTRLMLVAIGFACGPKPAPTTAAMPRATNKLRVVRDGNRARIWAIGVDVRHPDLEQVTPADVAAGAAP